MELKMKETQEHQYNFYLKFPTKVRETFKINESFSCSFHEKKPAWRILRSVVSGKVRLKQNSEQLRSGKE